MIKDKQLPIIKERKRLVTMDTDNNDKREKKDENKKDYNKNNMKESKIKLI